MGDAAAVSLLLSVVWLVGSVMGLCAGMLIGEDELFSSWSLMLVIVSCV